MRSRAERRYRTVFNPMAFLLDLDAWVARAGVRILFDTRFCDVAMRVRRITAALVENKGGRSALRCRAAVDASGDGDVCVHAGEPVREARTNVAAEWYYSASASGATLRPCSEAFDFATLENPPESANLAGDDPGDVTEHCLRSRRLIRSHLERVRLESPGEYPVTLPSIPCFRMTRRMASDHELEEGDDRVWVDDCIGMIGHWLKRGPVYYVATVHDVKSRNRRYMVVGVVQTKKWVV